jgi:hypothetical protein
MPQPKWNVAVFRKRTSWMFSFLRGKWSRCGLGGEVWQSLLQSGFLLRVFIDIDRTPMEVVTVYRTSKIDKYWRVE